MTKLSNRPSGVNNQVEQTLIGENNQEGKMGIKKWMIKLNKGSSDVSNQLYEIMGERKWVSRYERLGKKIN